MSTRVTINIGFYFQKQHYAQLQAYIPRSEALSFPQLLILQREKSERLQPEPGESKGRQGKSESKKQSDEDSEEQDNNAANEMDLQNDIDNEMENEEDNEIDADQQNEVERALEQLEEENYDSEESSEEEEDEDEDLDELSSLSNQSPAKGYNSNKTKRQKGETKDLVQLPDRRPRKDKKLDEATEIIRRQEKERKRKQYLKKQVEAQEKATLEKILNETGRKLRMREEKEMQDEIDREQKVYKSLGNVPKIITIIAEQGSIVMTHNTPLFPHSMTQVPQLKMREICSHCGDASKYRLKGAVSFACSLPCYKIVAAK